MSQLLCRQSSSLFKWSSLEVKEQGQHTRSRRTPQEKVIDRQLTRLFGQSVTTSLIGIVFRDMEQAGKIFGNGESSEGEDEGNVGEDQRESSFIYKRQQMARECIKSFLGDYISKCKDSKYEVLEAFMKGVVFEKKKLRESYLQEILKAHIDSGYRSAIEAYLWEKKHVIDSEQPERISLMEWVEASVHNTLNGGGGPFSPRLLIFTNRGIHLMKPPTGKPCTVCPPEALCPNGPRPDLKFTFDRLSEIITFPDLPQRLILSFASKPSSSQSTTTPAGSQQQQQIALTIPTHQGFKDIQQHLKEVTTIFSDCAIYQKQDFMLRGALQRYLIQPEEQELIFTCYISHNPSKGFLSMMSAGVGSQADQLIQNCTLLVLTSQQIMFFKENWSKWMFVGEISIIETLLEKIVNGGNDITPSDSSMLIPQAQRQHEAKLRQAIEGVLTVTSKYRIEQIENLHVHRGKDAVVDIEFGGVTTEKLIFQSDYARQEFLQRLVDVKNGKKQYNSSESSSDDGDNGEESD